MLFVPLLYFDKGRAVADGRFQSAAQIAVTFLLVIVGWVIFRSADIHHALDYIRGMFSLNVFSVPDLPKKTLFYAVECFAAIAFLMVMESRSTCKANLFAMPAVSYRVRRMGYLMVSVWTFLFYTVGQTFIYFQF